VNSQQTLGKRWTADLCDAFPARIPQSKTFAPLVLRLPALKETVEQQTRCAPRHSILSTTSANRRSRVDAFGATPPPSIGKQTGRTDPTSPRNTSGSKQHVRDMSDIQEANLAQKQDSHHPRIHIHFNQRRIRIHESWYSPGSLQTQLLQEGLLPSCFDLRRGSQ